MKAAGPTAIPPRPVLARASDPPPPGALADSALIIEGEMADYVPGATGGGLLLGGRTAGGIALGVTLGIGSEALTIDGKEQSQTPWGYGAGLRARFFASTDNRLSLDFAVDARFVYGIPSGIKTSVTGAGSAEVTTTNGYVLGAGPMATYWLHPSLGIAYSPRLTLLRTSGVDRTSIANVVRVIVAF
jgi:hypothetical protein